MKNTTNILLMVVAILLFAVLIDRKVNSNNLKADGAINNIIFAIDPSMKQSFYLVSTESKNIMYYEYDQGTKSILLKATRQYDYDQQLPGSYRATSNPGDTYPIVKKAVEDNGSKPKK